MMISVITLGEKILWDKRVHSFKNYDVCYLNDYARAFWQHGDGEPFLFYFENNSTKAMNVSMKRDIAKLPFLEGRLPVNTWFDLSTPYGYGGFWVEGEDFEEVGRAYDAYCRSQGFVSEFVRFHLLGGAQEHFNGDVEFCNHNVVRSLDLPPDELMMDFEHKVRKNLKRAASSNLKVEIDETGKRFSDFLNIYYGTMQRTNASGNYFFAEQFFETLRQMKENHVFFHVLYDQRVVSTELILFGTESCYSFLGGTDSKYFPMRPNELLKFSVIRWAKEKGLKRFILGGGYGDDDGIFQYKKSFAPNGIVDFHIGKRIIDKEKYEKLVELRKQTSDFNGNSSFFPLYRS